MASAAGCSGDSSDLKLSSLRVICTAAPVGSVASARASVASEDTMDEMVEDDLLSDSETEEASLLRFGDSSAKPIPIPSHKRRPVVKYEEGRKINLCIQSCIAPEKSIYVTTNLQNARQNLTL